VKSDLNTNLQTLMRSVDEAAFCGARLVLFPEAVLTGLINNDNYEHDKNIAIELNSQYIVRIKEKASEKGIWIALGFFEMDNGVIYDSAILINGAGQIVLHQKRTSCGWRALNLPSGQYAEGKVFQTIETHWGKAGFLICGDLFDTWEAAKDAKLDLLLFPFARCFNERVKDLEKEWETEWADYAEQIRKVGAGLTLGANYISPPEPGGHSGYFGGAFMADNDGNLLSKMPLNQEGLLNRLLKQ
ncbi:MAG: carbon-nitrogen hydrolase family protein, partial [Bacteroidales bacterium]|nr:carbon-nitrogen hydrolase family protein [Bacteroidales bacterium]